MERIENSLAVIETNMDEIVNSNVTRDIIDSLRRSTEAMKGQLLPMGGMEVSCFAQIISKRIVCECDLVVFHA